METPGRIARLFTRLAEAVTGLAGKLRRENPPVDPPPAMIGLPPSARPLWHVPAAHAQDSAERYAESMDYAVSQRMVELGIPDHQIGRPDADHGGQWRAFFPHEGNSGGVVGAQINADAGLFDTDLMARKYSPEIGKQWEHDRLRDRLDQVIAHEYAEASGLSHEEAVQRAAETPLAIREKAKERLRAMAEAENRGKGR
ncbi:MAG TPA: hypothetical protein VKA15_21000, partial [Isosphaeraceae bacterium]|nr:hypothetical protein [Isosphaeraceae bacterium]